MTRGQINIRWAVSGLISAMLLIVLAAILPRLPSFDQLHRVDGVVDTSTVDSRVEYGQTETVYLVTLEGVPNASYVVMKGSDAGFYRATQTVASGDDVTLWTYPIRGASDQRIWQLSDRGELIVNYNEVYGVEKRWRSQIIEFILFLLLLVNGITALIIKNQNYVPPPLPRMLEFGD